MLQRNAYLPAKSLHDIAVALGNAGMMNSISTKNADPLLISAPILMESLAYVIFDE